MCQHLPWLYSNTHGCVPSGRERGRLRPPGSALSLKRSPDSPLLTALTTAPVFSAFASLSPQPPVNGSAIRPAS